MRSFLALTNVELGFDPRHVLIETQSITGETLEAYFQQHIFEPLGMKDTSFAVPLAKQSRVPTKYDRVNGRFQEQQPSPIPTTPTAPFHGDGGLYSTAEDYGKFMQMILNGGNLGSVKILSETSVKLMGENNIGSIFVELQSSRRRLARQAVSARRRSRQIRPRLSDRVIDPQSQTFAARAA